MTAYELLLFDIPKDNHTSRNENAENRTFAVGSEVQHCHLLPSDEAGVPEACRMHMIRKSVSPCCIPICEMLSDAPCMRDQGSLDNWYLPYFI